MRRMWQYPLSFLTPRRNASIGPINRFLGSFLFKNQDKATLSSKSPYPKNKASLNTPISETTSTASKLAAEVSSDEACLTNDYRFIKTKKSRLNLPQQASISLRNKELCGPNVVWTDGPPIQGPTFIRQCTASGQWSIFAVQDYKYKPIGYKLPEKHDKDYTAVRPPWKADCPFCPGNESKCPDALYEINSSSNGKNEWLLRVLPNKFSFLKDAPYVICGFWGQHLQVTGTGVQEVIVLSRLHNTCPALMSQDELYLCMEALYLRGKRAAADPRVLYAALFQNHGLKSGGSLEHSHFQIVGLPIVPTTVLHRLEHARRFYEENNECVFCRILLDELFDLEGDGTRIVYQNGTFVAFVPYAATRAYQLWILPRHHTSNFLDMPSKDLLDLTQILHACLRMLYTALDDPDYNIVIRTAPPRLTENKQQKLRYVANAGSDWDSSYHWYLEITPHTSEWAGFSCFDMVVLKMLPEKMAEHLVKAHRSNKTNFKPLIGSKGRTQ